METKPTTSSRLQLHLQPETEWFKKDLDKFCEGNAGCARVIKAIIDKGHLVAGVLGNLQDMNIRGHQVWVLFRDVAKGNIDTLIDLVLERDKHAVIQLNKITYRPEKKDIPAVYSEQAVVRGWKP